MALYQLKPASRSLFIESLGAQQLPYVWIVTALTMGVFIAFYHRLVERYSRINVVLGTCLVVSALLVFFRLLLNYPGPLAAAGLYIFVDILGVVLIEQFWSLTNSIYTTREGRTWYGFVGTGGLVGGVLGGWVSAILIKYTALQTPDLLLTAATKISDRALSYSINRASKELLYVPVGSVLIYQAKAWIDMFGYRLFKVAGSVLILLFTQWLPFTVSLPQLSWFTISICIIWIISIMVLRNDYQVICEQSVSNLDYASR